MPIVASKKKQRSSATSKGRWPYALIFIVAAICVFGAWLLAKKGEEKKPVTMAAPAWQGCATTAHPPATTNGTSVHEGHDDATLQPQRQPTVAIVEEVQDNTAQQLQPSPAMAEEPVEDEVFPKGWRGHGAPPIFENPVEDNLEAISRQGFESSVTHRVDLPQEEIIEILKRPVEIYDDDDDALVAAKERTAEVKKAALEFIESGGTFNQFLRDLQAAANEARETVRDVQEEMKRILFEEGEEAAQAYLDGQNQLLREQGLEEVRIGKGLIRMMERRKARQAEQWK